MGHLHDRRDKEVEIRSVLGYAGGFGHGASLAPFELHFLLAFHTWDSH